MALRPRDILGDKLYIILNPVWYKTIEKGKKIFLKLLMVPEANKQQ